jgi:hypothetical protein
LLNTSGSKGFCGQQWIPVSDIFPDAGTEKNLSFREKLKSGYFLIFTRNPLFPDFDKKFSIY